MHDDDIALALGNNLPLEDRLRLATYAMENHPVFGRLLPVIHEAADLIERIRWDLDEAPPGSPDIQGGATSP